MQPRTAQFQKIHKARVAKKLSERKRQYIPIQHFCKGKLQRFLTQMPPVADIHDWSARCEHLESGFVCRLLADHDFIKLTNPRIARCTLPELILLSEWFLDDYLGPYFRSLFEPPRSNGNAVPESASEDLEKCTEPSIQQAASYRASLEETIEMDPDYGRILQELEESTHEWPWDNTPLNWFKHIEIHAHKHVRTLVKKKIPCGSCNYYRWLDGRCVLRNVRKHQTGRGCTSYRPMVVESTNLMMHDNSTVSEKIIWRLITLLANAVEEATDKPRLTNKLERLHLTALEWVQQGTNGNEPRGIKASRRGVSTKTIDRDKHDLAKIFKRFRNSDPELQGLFMQLEMTEDLFLNVSGIGDSHSRY